MVNHRLSDYDNDNDNARAWSPALTPWSNMADRPSTSNGVTEPGERSSSCVVAGKRRSTICGASAMSNGKPKPDCLNKHPVNPTFFTRKHATHLGTRRGSPGTSHSCTKSVARINASKSLIVSAIWIAQSSCALVKGPRYSSGKRHR